MHAKTLVSAAPAAEVMPVGQLVHASVVVPAAEYVPSAQASMTASSVFEHCVMTRSPGPAVEHSEKGTCKRRPLLAASALGGVLGIGLGLGCGALAL